MEIDKPMEIDKCKKFMKIFNSSVDYVTQKLPMINREERWRSMRIV
jgi:hypothetical protein